MYLLATRLQAKRGMTAEAGDYVRRAREVVSSAAGLPFSAWAVAAGDDLGVFVMSARIESFDQYMAANQAISQHPDFQALSKASVDVIEGPTRTGLGQVVAAAGEVSDTPRPLAVVTTATAAPGQQATAIAWATNLLNHVTELTGVAGMVTASIVGNIGNINWVQGLDSGAEIDELNAKLQADAGYLELVGQSGSLLVAGSSRRVMLAQLP